MKLKETKMIQEAPIHWPKMSCFLMDLSVEVVGMEKRLFVVQTEKMAVHPLAKGLKT